MTWRSSSISPVRRWLICGFLARTDIAQVATPEEIAVLRYDGLISPHSLSLTTEGYLYANLRDHEITWRQNQWRLHQDRS